MSDKKIYFTLKTPREGGPKTVKMFFKNDQGIQARQLFNQKQIYSATVAEWDQLKLRGFFMKVGDGDDKMPTPVLTVGTGVMTQNTRTPSADEFLASNHDAKIKALEEKVKVLSSMLMKEAVSGNLDEQGSVPETDNG